MWDIFTESVVGRSISYLAPNLINLDTHEKPTSDAGSDQTKAEQSNKSPLVPMNWSLAKKNFVLFQICFLTWGVYGASAIYSPGIEEVSQELHIGTVTATLGLTLFVIGYSVGPVIWTIFSEDVRFGRSPIIVGTLFVFMLLQVGCALVKNAAGLMILRFLSGVFGSPALALPASMIFDMYPATQAAYAIALWGCSAAAGPTMGPLMSGFAIMKEDWRWAFWIVLWMSAASFVINALFLPETLPANIKMRRCKLCEEERVALERTETQRKESSQGMGTLIMKISFLDPIALSLNMYIALLYGILYVWFESFPIVFIELYGFNLGELGLSFLGLAIGVAIGCAGYFIYVAKFINPRIRRDGGIHPIEHRLYPGFVTSFTVVICLFMFGWSSGRTHWIVPIIATGFFGMGLFLAFQSVIIYLMEAYGMNAPAAMAGNALIRGGFGAAFPLFGRALFTNLVPDDIRQGVAWGSSLLGFISVVFFPIPFVLYKYGHTLRERSPLAATYGESKPSDAEKEFGTETPAETM